MDQETIDDTQESTTDEAVDETTTEESSSDDVEALKAENERLAKVAKQQQDRAVKAEKQLKSAKSQTQDNSPISDEKYERLDLKTDGYKAEEVDLIMELGGRKVIDNPVVKEAIASMRKKTKSQDATPSGTAKSPVFQKYTERDLRNMPLAELEKIIPQGD